MANTADIVSTNMAIAVKANAKNIVSTLFNNNVILALLAERAGLKPDVIFGIGDPDVKTVLSGTPLPKAIIDEIPEVASWSPRNLAVKSYDGKTMALRDTVADISAGSGATLTATVTSGVITSVTVSAGGSGFSGSPTLEVTDATGKGAILRAVISGGAIASVSVISGGHDYTSPTISVTTGVTAGERYARPVFKWTHFNGIGFIYNHDLDRAKEMAASAYDPIKAYRVNVGSLVQDEMKIVTTGQAEDICNRMLYGNEAGTLTQTDDLWTDLCGIYNAINTTGLYAGLDRSVAANAYWKGNRDATAHTFTLQQLIQDALYTKGMAHKGGNVDVIVVGDDLYPAFESEISARYVHQAGVTLPELGQYGFTKQVLRYNNTYVIHDWRVRPKNAIALNLATWLVAFKKGKKWAASELYDDRAQTNGRDGQKFFVDSQLFLACLAPSLNAIYTNITPGS